MTFETESVKQKFDEQYAEMVLHPSHLNRQMLKEESAGSIKIAYTIGKAMLLVFGIFTILSFINIPVMLSDGTSSMQEMLPKIGYTFLMDLIVYLFWKFFILKSFRTIADALENERIEICRDILEDKRERLDTREGRHDTYYEVKLLHDEEWHRMDYVEWRKIEPGEAMYQLKLHDQNGKALKLNKGVYTARLVILDEDLEPFMTQYSE